MLEKVNHPPLVPQDKVPAGLLCFHEDELPKETVCIRE